MKKPLLRPGFTLTELLVVIAIIIALAALGFTGIGKAVAAAKAAKCASNLRQAGVLVSELRDEGVDNKGKTLPGNFPPYGGYFGPGGGWKRFAIVELLGEKAGLCEYDGKKYKWSVHPSETIFQNPLSKFKLGGDLEIAEIDLGDHANKEPRKGGFGYNHLLNGWVTPNSEEDNGHLKRTRLGDVEFPSSTIMMGEQSDKTLGSMIIGPRRQSPWGSYKDGAYCLFVDGSVQHLKNEFLRSEEAVKKHFRPTGEFEQN